VCLQSLTGKLLEPPKSLKEAARRAWAPLGATRTLDWRRRQSKAAALAAIDQAQLLCWYDAVVHPGGASHAALCVEVWGGDASAVAASEQEPGTNTLVLREASLQAFKRAQPLLPLPEMVLPPPAAGE
jgi:secreted Zn-dependent insulinase-like peptidase